MSTNCSKRCNITTDTTKQA